MPKYSRRLQSYRRTSFETCEPRCMMTGSGPQITTLAGLLNDLRSSTVAWVESAFQAAPKTPATAFPDREGHSVSTALQLGSLGLQKTVTGNIGAPGDVDYFQFTAPRSGTFKVTVTPDAGLTTKLQYYYVGRWRNSISGNTVTLALQKGTTYTLQLRGLQGTGNYRLDFLLKPDAQKLGAIDTKDLRGQHVRGEKWYRFTTMQAGTLDIQGAITKASKNIRLELYDAKLRKLDTAATQSQILTTEANAGQTFFLRVASSQSSFAVQLVNDPLPLPPDPDPQPDPDPPPAPDPLPPSPDPAPAVPLPQWVYEALADSQVTTITMPQGRYTLSTPLVIGRSNVTLDLTGCTLVLSPNGTINNSFGAIRVESTIQAFSNIRAPSHLHGQITASTTQLTMDPAEIVGLQAGEVVQIQAGVNATDPAEPARNFVATVQSVDLQTGVITFTAPLGADVPVYADFDALKAAVAQAYWDKLGVWGLDQGGNFAKGLGYDHGLLRFVGGSMTTNVTILNPTFEVVIPPTAAELPNGSFIMQVWDAANVTIKNLSTTNIVGSLLHVTRAYNLLVDGVQVRGTGVAKVWNGPTGNANVFSAWGGSGLTYRNIDVQGTNMVLLGFEVAQDDVLFDHVQYNVHFDGTLTYPSPGVILGFFGTGSNWRVTNSSFMATGNQQLYALSSYNYPQFDNITIPAAYSPFYLDLQHVHPDTGTFTIDNTAYGPLVTENQIITLNAPFDTGVSFLKLPQGLYRSIKLRTVMNGGLTSIFDGGGGQYKTALEQILRWTESTNNKLFAIQPGEGVDGYAENIAHQSFGFEWAGGAPAVLQFEIEYYPIVNNSADGIHNGLAVSKSQNILGANGDAFSIDVLNSGKVLRLQTTTPNDSVSLFPNTLNPRLELFDPTGRLVATGVALDDGRNEGIAFPTLISGTYHVLVTSELSTSGTYFLNTQSRILGDFNQDWTLSSDDLTAILRALTDLNSYQTANGLTDASILAVADINHDGSVNNRDIQAMISLLNTI